MGLEQQAGKRLKILANLDTVQTDDWEYDHGEIVRSDYPSDEDIGISESEPGEFNCLVAARKIRETVRNRCKRDGGTSPTNYGRDGYAENGERPGQGCDQRQNA